MSLHQQARALIDQAEVAIKAENQQYAIELLRQSILYNGKDADAYLLLGVALAQSRMAGDAENAFVRATQLAPESVKARYNLAVHLYTEGQLQRALATAREAVEIDIRHAGSQDLVTRLENELGLAPGEAPARSPLGNPVPVELRPGYDEQPVETIGFVEKLGPWWVTIGWGIALLSLTGFVIMLLMVSPLANSSNAEQVMKSLSANSLYSAFQAGYFATILLGLVWTAMDAINRRGNLFWVLPQIVCGCVGFTWLAIPIYMLFGRKPEPPVEGNA